MINKFFEKKKILLVIFAAIVLGASLYYFLVYKKSGVSSQDPTQAAVIESQNLIEKVGKLIELPVGEQPQIATVSDVSKLPNQPFFSKAQNGDKVLIYNIAQKAILYRPNTNKIIDVAPLVAKPTTEPVQIQATVSATVTVYPTVIKKSPSPTPTVTQ
nr:hypothetical protein [Candidatus Levybacteria bacterium]